ncbi:hypothetical protein [Paludisphaera soli]|uniref:hypothetical protein n=1 Tax=Paludisphaera soli TaxID=2712865 RepID=UPI0013EBAD8A|nr:hypothetical protein [Paludisphaera soli]
MADEIANEKPADAPAEAPSEKKPVAEAKPDGETKPAAEEAKADKDDASLFTAEEYEDYLALKSKVSGFDDKLKQVMSETEREKVRLKAEKAEADRKVAAAEKAKNDEAAKLQQKLDAITKQLDNAKKIAAEKERDAAIDAAIRGVQFVGPDAATQAKAAGTFLKLAQGAIQSVEDDDGRLTVQGVDGKPAKEVLSALLEEHSYLVARKGRGGSGAGGGEVPGGVEVQDATKEYFERKRAARASQSGGYGLWAPSENASRN